jgi:hypothetical protein
MVCLSWWVSPIYYIYTGTGTKTSAKTAIILEIAWRREEQAAESTIVIKLVVRREQSTKPKAMQTSR